MTAKKKTQTELDGFERPAIESLDSACMTYRENRDERMKLTKEETESKSQLQALLIEHEAELERDSNGNAVYHFEDGDVRYAATLSRSVNVTVRKVKPEDEPPGLTVHEGGEAA